MTASQLMERLRNVDPATPVLMLNSLDRYDDIMVAAAQVDPTTSGRWWEGKYEGGMGVDCLVLFRDSNRVGDPECT